LDLKRIQNVGIIVFVIWFSGFCMIAFGGYGVYLDFTKREVVTHVQSFASLQRISNREKRICQ
jgi:hypothetical protein